MSGPRVRRIRPLLPERSRGWRARLLSKTRRSQQALQATQAETPEQGPLSSYYDHRLARKLEDPEFRKHYERAQRTIELQIDPPTGRHAGTWPQWALPTDPT
jgi:hypothetical protein